MATEAPAPPAFGYATHPHDPSASRRRRRTLTAFVGCLTAISTLLSAPSAFAAGLDSTAWTRTVRQAPPGARASDGAQVTAVRWLDKRTADLTIASPAMGKAMPVRMILPRSWFEKPKRTYPTLYLLQGASDDYTSWTRETDIEQLASDAEVIVVTPEGGRAGFNTDWWNYGRGGTPRWETFHTAELPQILERGYRANSRRAAIGISSGGLGALNYAGRHRGKYVFAGSFSGPTDLSDRELRDGIEATCMREGVDWLRLWGDPDRQRRVWNAHDPSYRPERLRGVKVHLSAATGKPGPLDKTQNSEERLTDLTSLQGPRKGLRAGPAGLRSLPRPGRPTGQAAFETRLEALLEGQASFETSLEAVVAGQTSLEIAFAGYLEAPMYRPTARFARQLRKAGVDVTANLYPTGTHRWPYWQRELHVAWPSMLAALRGAR